MDEDVKNAEVSKLHAQIEDLKEELHSAYLKINSKIAVENHVAEEIELLHQNLEDEKMKKNKLLLNFEEEMKNFKKSWKEEVDTLKAEHEEKAKIDAEKVESLEKELRKSKECIESMTEKCNQAKENVDQMAKTLAEESERRQKMEETYKEMEHKMVDMQLKFEELILIKEAKVEEVESLKERITQAEEESAIYSSQLRELQPLVKDQAEPSVVDDASHKGNSLFAEVDDRRQAMKAHLLCEKKRNAKLQQAYTKKCNEANHLKAQLEDTTRLWKDEDKDRTSSQESLIASLKSHIEYLEKEVKSLEKQNNEMCNERMFSTRAVGEPLAEYKCLEMDLARGRKEIKELKEKLHDISMEKILQDQKIYEFESSLRKLKAENAHLARLADRKL